MCVFSVVSDSVAPWTVALKAPLCVGFSRQEHWSGCHFLLQGIFLTQGLSPCLLCLLHWPADFLLVPPRSERLEVKLEKH